MSKKYFLMLKSALPEMKTGFLYPITEETEDTVRINRTHTFDYFTWGAVVASKGCGEVLAEETVHTMELGKYIIGQQPDPNADVDFANEPDIDEEFDVDESEPIQPHQQFHPIPLPDEFKGKTESVTIKRSKEYDADQYGNIIKPEYYHEGGIDVIGFAKKKLSAERVKGFYQINVMKYITRYERKNKLDDLKKAKNYLDMLIEAEQNG